MGGNLYPALTRMLEAAGCEFVRQGRGSHEIWKSPISKRSFSVPKNTQMVHTANKILKDAGLSKAF